MMAFIGKQMISQKSLGLACMGFLSGRIFRDRADLTRLFPRGMIFSLRLNDQRPLNIEYLGSANNSGGNLV